MSHVDESLLVAYVDDALDADERARVETHLVSCAECRARVEDERALAQGAAAVLDASAPARQAEMLPFAEIVRRSEESDATSSGSARERTSRSWTMPPLAWAAMLVVGLGAAVIARTLLVSPEFNAPAQSTVEEAAPAAGGAAARSIESPAESAEAADVDAQSTGALTGVQPTEAGDALTSDALDAPVVQRAVPVPAPPAPAPPPAPDLTAAKAAAEPSAVQADRPRPEDAPFEPSRERERYADMVRRDSAARSESQVQLRRSGLEARTEAIDEVVVTGVMTSPGAVAIRSDDAIWRAESLTEARARGVMLRGLPGVPVTSAWLARDAAPWRARIVQQYDDVSIEIIEWRNSPGTSGQSGVVGDGRNYLYIEDDDVTFLVRAALPIERLEALAASLQPLE